MREGTDPGNGFSPPAKALPRSTHVFSYIVLGQPIGQCADVSKEIASELAGMFPAVRRIAANIAEFEKATYFNREMLRADG